MPQDTEKLNLGTNKWKDHVKGHGKMCEEFVFHLGLSFLLKASEFLFF